jgi:transcriptional regulator with XRE-family HTH domain
MKNLFGEKLRRLRESRGVSQNELNRRLGYGGNSYVYDVEQGKFSPPEEKLREIARALEVPYQTVQDLALEAKLDGLGISEPGFVSLLKDYPRLSQKEQKEILKAYFKVKEARQHSDGADH